MKRESVTRKPNRHLAYAFALLFLGAAAAEAGAPLVKTPPGLLDSFWIEEKSGPADPVRKVSVGALEAQAHAVTNGDFLAFLKAHPQWQKSRVSPLFADEAYLKQFSGDLTLRAGVKKRAPVTYVSWHAANAYCESLGLRLPTTDEWEYLAAASETKPEASKDPAFLGRILEWYSRPRSGELPPVKSTYRNYFGLYDMHGLIWEWVEDFNSNLVTGESREDGSVNRNLFCGAGNLSGGNKENYAAFMRFAFRSSMKGKGAVWNLGFRCVR